MNRASVSKYTLMIPFIFLCVISCRKEDVEQPYNSGNHFLGKAAAQYDAAFVRSFYDLTCKIVKSTKGFFPPQASRAYSYISLALYEATVPGIDYSYTLAGQINGLSPGALPKPLESQQYNWAIAANAALSEMTQRMFEINISNSNLQAVKDLEAQNKATLSAGVYNDIVARSEAFGKSIATALYNYSKTDGGHQSYLDPFQLPYTLPAGTDQWVPTGAVLSPVSPKWGNNRAFITANVTSTDPPPCYPFSIDSASKLYQDAYQVYQQVKHNTPEQIAITKFWADDPFNTCTPTGHTFNILTQLLEENQASLAKAAVAYGKAGVAEYDAFVACWKCKYKANLLRPVTYIRKYIDPSFTTVIGTPPFPAYISGHSVEIGAGSRIFAELFGDGNGNYKLTDRSQIQYGFSARTYNSFDEMALECANSRFYGGIHFLQDNLYGLEQGKAIGNNVNQLLKWPSVK